METHITTERDLLVTFLTNMRSWYATGLFDKYRSKASEDGTVLGIIDEVSYKYMWFVRSFFLVRSWRLSTNCLPVCMSVCISVCISVCMYVCLYVCLYVCFCLFVHLYVQYVAHLYRVSVFWML